MLLMSKKKDIEPKAEPEQISVKLPEDIRKALANYRASFKVQPGRSDTVVVALQEFLAREGFYPPEVES